MIRFLFALLVITLLSCKEHEAITPKPIDTPVTPSVSNRDLIETVQKATFQYFWDYAHPISGMARERTSNPDTVTSGGTGFGIASIVVATERGWITRSQAAERLIKIASFLENADRFHGAWSHWLNGKTGKVIAFSGNDDGGDLVETSFLVNGLLIAREYFNGATADEVKLRALITRLWEGVEWNWYTKGNSGKLFWHWSPSKEWEMNMPISGFNECLITYVLALSSPTHPISAETYQNCWIKLGNYTNARSYLGYNLNVGFPFGGPLFFSHYSFIGLDPRQMGDSYTRYWTHNLTHTLINREYCINNAPKTNQYSGKVWGLTASDNPWGYGAHTPDNDNGTITPTAALSAFPYTPYYSMQVLRNLYENYKYELWGKYGFYDAFNLKANWYSKQYLAIDQGPIVCMIENYRSGLLWNLLMRIPDIKAGLAKAQLDKPNYETGFALAVAERNSSRVDLMVHPDRDVYEVDYFIREAGRVTVDLNDADGKLVTKLLDGASTNVGMHKVSISSATKRGDYEIKMLVNGSSYSLKITLR